MRTRPPSQQRPCVHLARLGALVLGLGACDHGPATSIRESTPRGDASDGGLSDAALAAHEGGIAIDDSDASRSDAAAEDPIPEPDASLEIGETFHERDPAYLFDPSSLRTFELHLSRENLAKLDADPAAEQYVPGKLAFEGGLIADVGIRYKGSVGAFLFCLSGGSFPPRGSKTCVKLGMKVKIDYTDDDARFFRQKKLQFHAMNLDASLLRERFGYDLFNTMGVHAPRTAHVRLVVNGKFIGLFLLVEVIEGPFSRGLFADGGEGNIYKEVWPASTDESHYLGALESNRNDSASAAKMVALANALAAADDQTLPDVVNHWFDAEYVARFIAVDRAIRHDDGPHHWYCQDASALVMGEWSAQRSFAGTTCGNHNYFWYEDTASEHLWPIPWDLDNAMVVGTGFTSVLSYWDDLSPDCTNLLRPSFGAPQMPITCDPLHRGFALALREQVREALDTLAIGPLSETELDAKLAPWIAQLEPAVLDSNQRQLSEPSLASWKSAVQSLRTAILTLRDEAVAHANQ